jgi:hypothetical protein
MDIIESPRRALANRKKRLSAGKAKAPLPVPPFMPSTLEDQEMVDVDSSFRDRSDTFPMELDTDQVVLMHWLERDAPSDILPKILSFAGPQKISALCRVNKAWNQIASSRAIFRTMCEDYGKWQEGDSGEASEDPHFWKKVYCSNPIVPLEFKTIYRAMEAACKRRQYEGGNHFECDRNIRILVQPGVHALEREIVVETMADTTFTVETHTKCSNLVAHGRNSLSPLSSPAKSSDDTNPSARTRRRLNSGRAIRDLLRCRTSSGVDQVEFEYEIPMESNYYSRDQATILLKTGKRNSPIFHIRQGRMKLSNLSLIHYCRGTDIWNGNSAVQIQPRLDERHQPVIPTPPQLVPTAYIENSKIMSLSGRGVVCIDGSRATVRNCYVHRCAATGIYIGGSGSEASIYHTDIINNGIGNTRNRNGIARGHSGVYLEQGTALVDDCSISRNALTGLSAVSVDNAFLNIRNSELVGNATLQLEMPREDSVSFRNSTSTSNRIARDGDMMPRSGLTIGNFEDGSDSERSA